MINAYVTTTALKISNEVMPDNPNVLYYSIITIVDLIDRIFKNCQISPALKNECVMESMFKTLRPILEATGTEYTIGCIYEIMESYKEGLKTLDRFV